MQFAAGQTAFAEALLDPARALPEGITTARGEADPVTLRRLSQQCLRRADGGAGKALPGRARGWSAKDFFAGMARAYAGLEKPASPLLFEYGDGFPEFIEQFEPARGLAYLADVARIEAAWTRAYHAEDAEPVVPAQLASLEPGELARTRFAPHPAASLISSPIPHRFDLGGASGRSGRACAGIPRRKRCSSPGRRWMCRSTSCRLGT